MIVQRSNIQGFVIHKDLISNKFCMGKIEQAFSSAEHWQYW